MNDQISFRTMSACMGAVTWLKKVGTIVGDASTDTEPSPADTEHSEQPDDGEGALGVSAGAPTRKQPGDGEGALGVSAGAPTRKKRRCGKGPSSGSTPAAPSPPQPRTTRKVVPSSSPTPTPPSPSQPRKLAIGKQGLLYTLTGELGQWPAVMQVVDQLDPVTLPSNSDEMRAYVARIVKFLEQMPRPFGHNKASQGSGYIRTHIVRKFLLLAYERCPEKFDDLTLKDLIESRAC